MSAIAPRSAANATSRPSGLMSGHSGPSTYFNSIRSSIFFVTTFCNTSVLFFSVRAK